VSAEGDVVEDRALVGDQNRASPVDAYLAGLADRARRRLSGAGDWVQRAISVLQLVAVAVAFVAWAVYFVLGVTRGPNAAGTTGAAEVMLYGLIVAVAGTVGARSSDYPTLRARVDPASGRRSHYYRRPPPLTKGTGRRRFRVWIRGSWPLVVATLAVLMAAAAAGVSRVGHPSPAGVLVGLAVAAILTAVLAYGDRRGRPWITALAVVVVLVAAFPKQHTNVERVLTVLLVLFGLAAVVTSVQHIVVVVVRGPAVRANAVIVAVAVALFVVVGGPGVYQLLGLGEAKGVRSGAGAIAASLVASAVFFAFSGRADREVRERLQAETRRADQAEVALLTEKATPSSLASTLSAIGRLLAGRSQL
jgi:hypothetical protein